MRSVKVWSILTALLFASACSTFSGGASQDATLGEEAAQTAQMRMAELEVEVARLKSENARLSNSLLDIQRENESLIAQSEETPGDAGGPELRADADELPVSSVMTPRTQPQAVVEETNAPDMARSDVPVQDAPRMVQPSFASTEAVFENEADADSEIETTSVLFGVHLASYRHIAEAREGWRKLQRENPDELGLLEPRLETVTIPEKGVFLRLIGGGFSSQEKAAALCANLKVKNLYCNVSSFRGQRLSLADTN